MNYAGSKLMRMCVYYFRCYWPSNLVFVITWVTSTFQIWMAWCTVAY